MAYAVIIYLHTRHRTVPTVVTLFYYGKGTKLSWLWLHQRDIVGCKLNARGRCRGSLSHYTQEGSTVGISETGDMSVGLERLSAPLMVLIPEQRVSANQFMLKEFHLQSAIYVLLT